MSRSGVKNTICALASAPGRAGISVLRVSGPQSLESLQRLSQRHDFMPRLASLCPITHPVFHQIIDRALVLFFPGPASYTGEDVVEYHLHGSRAVVDAMLDVLVRQPGHRLAAPGEFTRRAFENERMDLTAAEAVADLIDAETETQRLQALAQMGGALSRLYNGWSAQLSRALAHLEADIEFPDEDLPSGALPGILEQSRALAAEISAHLDDNRRGERLREGVHVAILGAPNAGKSSLINALARRNVAIVSDIAGTTRDVIEAHLNIGGYPVIVSDTAGLRPEEIEATGHDGLEAEGIRRAIERAGEADLKILLFDGTVDMPDPYTLNLIDDASLLVVNKMDDVLSKNIIEGAIPVSVKTGHNLPLLLEFLHERLVKLVSSDSRGPSPTRRRHREALEEALDCLHRADKADLPELAAEDLRLAMRAIGRITGQVDAEDLLDMIFRDFCIGK
ncbi:MAG: tRNA uridine-5-carboxymethylaminomethyl(34) synthesis GTPase MnmE [Alphaproteobacteria bacterium]|nr:tRNA uridine-5-carboxymethylaminomethyl(34) synthesis GTPase MnmE [Alphaproteobacteria bacterium]